MFSDTLHSDTLTHLHFGCQMQFKLIWCNV